ncbi:hypothetical protein A2W24_01815 [Microgenomates group bacterium RBG_16_45_19]|nr:MAG: hypothetical protein A2W24_01815 [Microgenomates group bacterium RBG_16_45_19]
MSDPRTEALRQIRAEVLALTTSPLYLYRRQMGYVPVIGQGNHQAQLLLVGEAPGEQEALTGIPFSGRAGVLLDALLTQFGLDRKDIYLTNVIKDRPPENRLPKAEEIAFYGPFLIRQIEIIGPQIIAALGKIAIDFLFKHYQLEARHQTMAQLHGQSFPVTSLFGSATLFPMYHPAAVLHNPSLKSALESDFKILSTLIQSC